MLKHPPQVSRVHMHLGVISQLYSLTLQTKGIAALIVAQELPAQELPVLEELQHAILLPTKPLCQWLYDAVPCPNSIPTLHDRAAKAPTAQDKLPVFASLWH